MRHLKSYKIFERKETMVDRKIQLLKDLAVDLEDLGFDVEVIKGTSSLKSVGYSNMLFSGDLHKQILLTIEDNKGLVYKLEDKENFIGTRISDLKVIKEFEETLKSYGMNPRGTSSGKHHITYRFDKHGKMTNSDLVK